MAAKRIRITRKLIVVGAVAVGMMSLTGTASASNIGAPAPSVDRCDGVPTQITKVEKSLCRGYAYQSPALAKSGSSTSAPKDSSVVQAWALFAGLGFAGLTGAFAATRKGPLHRMSH